MDKDYNDFVQRMGSFDMSFDDFSNKHSDNDELMHHGVKGQKWGVRRYQNSDGSLTSAGKKRYTQGSGKSDKPESAKATKATSNKAVDFVKKTAASGAEKFKAKRQAAVEKKEAEEAVKKERAAIEAYNRRPVSEMSDEELMDRIDRMALEKRYKDLNASLNPQTKSKAESIKDLVGDMVSDAVYKSGSQLLTQTLNHYGSKGLNALIKEVNGTKIAETKLELSKAVKKAEETRKEAAAAKARLDDANKAYKIVSKDESYSDEDKAVIKKELDDAKTDYDSKRHDATIATNEREVASAKVEAAKKPEEVIFANNKKK